MRPSVGLAHTCAEGSLLNLLSCPFTKAQALGNKGETSSLTSAHNTTVWRREGQPSVAEQ